MKATFHNVSYEDIKGGFLVLTKSHVEFHRSDPDVWEDSDEDEEVGDDIVVTIPFSSVKKHKMSKPTAKRHKWKITTTQENSDDDVLAFIMKTREDLEHVHAEMDKCILKHSQRAAKSSPAVDVRAAAPVMTGSDDEDNPAAVDGEEEEDDDEMWHDDDEGGEEKDWQEEEEEEEFFDEELEEHSNDEGGKAPAQSKNTRQALVLEPAPEPDMLAGEAGVATSLRNSNKDISEEMHELRAKLKELEEEDRKAKKAVKSSASSSKSPGALIAKSNARNSKKKKASVSSRAKQSRQGRIFPTEKFRSSAGSNARGVPMVENVSEELEAPPPGQSLRRSSQESPAVAATAAGVDATSTPQLIEATLVTDDKSDDSSEESGMQGAAFTDEEEQRETAVLVEAHKPRLTDNLQGNTVCFIFCLVGSFVVLSVVITVLVVLLTANNDEATTSSTSLPRGIDTAAPDTVKVTDIPTEAPRNIFDQLHNATSSPTKSSETPAVANTTMTPLEACTLDLFDADINADNMLSGLEYVDFLKLMDVDVYGNITAFEGLPVVLQDNYNTLLQSTPLALNVSGSGGLPIAQQDPTQAAFRIIICSSTIRALKTAESKPGPVSSTKPPIGDDNTTGTLVTTETRGNATFEVNSTITPSTTASGTTVPEAPSTLQPSSQRPTLSPSIGDTATPTKSLSSFESISTTPPTEFISTTPPSGSWISPTARPSGPPSTEAPTTRPTGSTNSPTGVSTAWDTSPPTASADDDTWGTGLDDDVFVEMFSNDPVLSLMPEYSVKAIVGSSSPHNQALAWLMGHPDIGYTTMNLDSFARKLQGSYGYSDYGWYTQPATEAPKTTMPDWRIQQLFALATFYYSFQGDSCLCSTYSNFLSYTVNECLWFQESGVFSDDPCTEDGRFLRIHLNEGSKLRRKLQPIESSSRFNLQGTMPLEIALLSNLQSISITATTLNNPVTDMIPETMSSLTSLSYLSLADNNLKGTIPSIIGTLGGLTHVALHLNYISGVIPSEVGLLTSMTALFLNGNTIRSSLPTTLGLLSKLQWLSLNDNQLNGQVPITFSNMASLENLQIQNNNLGGSIPSGLCYLSSLNNIYLDCEKQACDEACPCSCI